MGSLHLRNQLTVQERRVMELQTGNAQIQKTLSQLRTNETELEAEVSSLQAQFLAVSLQETSLQFSLEQERKGGEEVVAKLETVASEVVIAAYAELIQEFKDEESGEYDPDFWIGLSQGCEGVHVEKESDAMVNEDQVEQGQVGDAPPSTFSDAIAVGLIQPAKSETKHHEDMEHVAP